MSNQLFEVICTAVTAVTATSTNLVAKGPFFDGYDSHQADYSESATAETPGHIDANSASVTTADTLN